MKTRHEYSSTRVEFPPHPPLVGLSRSNLSKCIRQFQVPAVRCASARPGGGEKKSKCIQGSRQCADRRTSVRFPLCACIRFDSYSIRAGNARSRRGGATSPDLPPGTVDPSHFASQISHAWSWTVFAWVSSLSSIFILATVSSRRTRPHNRTKAHMQKQPDTASAEADPSGPPRRCTDRAGRGRALTLYAAELRQGPSERIRDAALLASRIQDDCINGRPDSTPTAAWVASGARLRSQCHSRRQRRQ